MRRASVSKIIDIWPANGHMVTLTKHLAIHMKIRRLVLQAARDGLKKVVICDPVNNDVMQAYPIPKELYYLLEPEKPQYMEEAVELCRVPYYIY